MTDIRRISEGPAIRIGLGVLIALIAVIGTAWIARRQDDGGWLRGTTAACDLPAYTTLDDRDVLLGSNRFASPKGQVLLRRVKKGEPIPSDAVVTPAGTVAGWSALAVKVDAPFAPGPGDAVRLVGVTNETTDVAFGYDGAVVLDRREDTILLAMPPEQASRAAKFLVGERRLIVLFRLPSSEAFSERTETPIPQAILEEGGARDQAFNPNLADP